MDSAAAARTEWIARPAFNGTSDARPAAATRALNSWLRCQTSRAPAWKRRWSGRNDGAVKPARSYSTGSSVRPMPASAAASASAIDSASGSS